MKTIGTKLNEMGYKCKKRVTKFLVMIEKWIKEVTKRKNRNGKKVTNITNTIGTKLNEIGTKEVTNDGKRLQIFSYDREMDKKGYKNKWKKGYKHNKYNWTEPKSEGRCRSAR